MAIPLSNMQEAAEVTIFHRILSESVEKGYSVDVSNSLLYPNTPQGMAAYEAAKKAIILDKGFVIDVFNNSNPDYKGLKKLPRIVIITEDPMPGDLGGAPDRIYTSNNDGTFTPRITPPEVYDITFAIYLLANTVKEQRVLIGLLANALPSRGYIPVHPRFNIPSNFFILNTSMATLPSAIDGVMEKVYRYTIKDIFLTEYYKEFPNVHQVEEITFVTINGTEDTILDSDVITQQD